MIPRIEIENHLTLLRSFEKRFPDSAIQKTIDIIDGLTEEREVLQRENEVLCNKQTRDYWWVRGCVIATGVCLFITIGITALVTAGKQQSQATEIRKIKLEDKHSMFVGEGNKWIIHDPSCEFCRSNINVNLQ